MAFGRTKEQASPFATTQTVAQTATAITNYLGRTITVADVVAQMALRSRPNATASTPVNFSQAELLLGVFQYDVTS